MKVVDVEDVVGVGEKFLVLILSEGDVVEKFYSKTWLKISCWFGGSFGYRARNSLGNM